MHVRMMLPALLCIALAGTGGAASSESSVGLRSNVTFSEYSTLSSSAEIVRRMMSPLDARRVTRAAAGAGRSLGGQPVDLAKERFALYVPPQAPSSGYGLLVYVSPYEDAQVPIEWTCVLDRHGLVFVTAARSGNGANVFDRREPLALLAAQNVMSRYPVDPARIYVGGFSGGSRVAERLAIAYPDLFHGVLLYAGSDPLGDARLPLPESKIFDRFQESTRVVLASGTRDEYHLAEDIQTKKSLQDWCVFDVFATTLSRTSHELPDARIFERLIDELVKNAPPDPGRICECRARIDRVLDARLSEVRGLVAAGKREAARRALGKVDAHFAGLAAPRSVELAETIE
jgi:predicted esterase